MAQMKFGTLVSIATTALLFATGSAFAAQDAIYDAPPPPDAAFVRVLNAGGTDNADLGVGSTPYSVPPLTLSSYAYVTQGDYDATGAQLHLSLAAQKYYTVIVGAGAPTLLPDEGLTNPAKVGLYFYNTTNVPLTLSASVNGKQAAVFENVGPGESKYREVKAFDVSFSLVADGKDVFDLPATTLQNQQGFSVAAVLSGDKIAGIQTLNTVNGSNPQ